MLDVQPVKILLVDDDEADIALTKRALKKNKIKVNIDICNDGVEALEYLRKEGKFANVEKPDLILLDLNMPRKDGRETLEEIRSDDSIKEIPVVILTTSDTDEDIIRTYKLGCNCYVTKSVDVNEFTKILQATENFWFTIVKLPNQR